MVVGRANSEELNVVESDEEITMLPPFYESHVKHSEFTQAIVNSSFKKKKFFFKSKNLPFQKYFKIKLLKIYN